jgi:hypothetical protein
MSEYSKARRERREERGERREERGERREERGKRERERAHLARALRVVLPRQLHLPQPLAERVRVLEAHLRHTRREVGGLLESRALSREVVSQDVSSPGVLRGRLERAS